MLRDDVVLEDVVLALLANDGLRAGPSEVRVAASRRFATLMLQSFGAEPQGTPRDRHEAAAAR